MHVFAGTAVQPTYHWVMVLARSELSRPGYGQDNTVALFSPEVMGDVSSIKSALRLSYLLQYSSVELPIAVFYASFESLILCNV